MKITANGISMNYALDGPAGAPVVTLSHSLATDLSMWAPQLKPLPNSARATPLCARINASDAQDAFICV